MGIFIDDPDLHIKMARVDEPNRVETTAAFFAEKTGEWSLKGAREEYEKLRQRIIAEKDPLEKAHMMAHQSTGIIIYGSGGWHRYYVRSDGNVVFSAGHGPRGVERAKAEGFGIHG